MGGDQCQNSGTGDSMVTLEKLAQHVFLGVYILGNRGCTFEK